MATRAGRARTEALQEVCNVDTQRGIIKHEVWYRQGVHKGDVIVSHWRGPIRGAGGWEHAPFFTDLL
jgi:hypothetical protein